MPGFTLVSTYPDSAALNPMMMLCPMADAPWRPPGWCANPGEGDVYTQADCNNDGVPDHVCTNTWAGVQARGTILSPGCDSVWPDAPLESCPAVFDNGTRQCLGTQWAAW
jgi:hypothetical protein